MADMAAMLANAPLGSLVESLGIAIANAQFAMDQNSLAILERMAAQEITLHQGDKPVKKTLLDLGFAPTFYHITEATVEARLAFSSSTSEEATVGASIRVGSAFSMVAAQVNASYTNKYSFHAEGSSRISTRFVSLPPPAELKEILASMRKGA
jgi:hypothetical protein